MSDVWKWEHQHAAPVLVSPSGVVRRVQKYVKPTRAGDDPWVQDTSDAAIFTEAMNQWEERRKEGFVEDPVNDEPSGRPFHLWESEELNVNIADVLSWGWRYQTGFNTGARRKIGVWLAVRGTEEEFIVGTEQAEEFIKHWRQYQQWRHINGK